jgi:malonyl-CoA/methylmalonyl-CoA synthetase
MAVPTIYHRLAQVPNAPPLPAMRLFVSGSAPLAQEDFAAFRARFDHTPLERYGLSETLILSSNPLRAERRAGTVGHALPGVQLRLAADGEIEARGPAVFAGYWRDLAGSREAFSDDFFRTGDLGEHDEAGYLRICGRKKELILVGGSNVLPGEVEAALGGDPGVDELAAAGLPDRDRGEIVALFVVLHGGTDASLVERRLRERAEARLAPYKRPLRYAFLPGLPRNAMGKIDRRALREKY